MTSDIAAVRKQVSVPHEPAEAFRLFTDEMAAWWPLESFSVGTDSATGVIVEPGVGGRIVETYGDGKTAVWGTVTAWDPPTGLAFTWHPGADESAATDVAITFAAAPDGGTAVELVHSGWEHHPRGAEARQAYEGGWDVVLGHYVTGAAG